jgi:HD-like signal output (HDOD) protein
MRLQAYIDAGRTPPSLDEVVRRVHEISTLPHVAIQVMKVAEDPHSGAADLKDILENDPSLSARVLRCVNSSAFATRERVNNLQQAIAYLGLKQIRNLAMTASVADLFKKDEKIGTYRRTDLWRHLVSVGICARLIAMRRRIDEFEDAFLAGLLHDLGIILEDQHVHPHFRMIIEALDKSKTLGEVERAHLGFDHTVLGGRVADAWGFPSPARAAVRHHHVSSNCRDGDKAVVYCVEVANLICTAKGYSSVGMKLVRVSQPALSALSLARDDITTLAEDLDAAIAESADLYQL